MKCEIRISRQPSGISYRFIGGKVYVKCGNKAIASCALTRKLCCRKHALFYKEEGESGFPAPAKNEYYDSDYDGDEFI